MSLPDGAMDKVNAAVQDFTAAFASSIAVSFFENAIENAKAEAQPKEVEDDPEQLLPLPTPNWTIKSGWMVKEGGNWTNWKRRFFVARNAADSFVIDYYSDDKCEDRSKKGTINCAGYRAKKDNTKKPNGITLTPWDEERRAWYIQCDNDEDQREWMSVFENATWHAKPARDADEQIQAAFELAFKKLQISRGFLFPLFFDRSPAEMLTKLLVMDLDRNILRDILAEINPPFGASTARGVARKMVIKTCDAACVGAWGVARQALVAARSTVEEKIKPGVLPIAKAQNDLKEKIVESVMSVATPVTDKLRDLVFAPLMGIVFNAMADGFKAAVKGFHTQASKKAATMKDTKVYQGMISDVAYSYWHESPMVEAYQLIRNLDETNLGTFCKNIPGISSVSFIYKLDSMLRDLLRRAIYTMHKYCAEMDPTAALTRTMGQLVHDAKLVFLSVVSSGFKYMIGEYFNENLIQPCLELVQPIADLIPEAFKTFLSIESILEEALNDIVDKCIKACTVDAAVGTAGTIDQWQG